MADYITALETVQADATQLLRQLDALRAMGVLSPAAIDKLATWCSNLQTSLKAVPPKAEAATQPAPRPAEKYQAVDWRGSQELWAQLVRQAIRVGDSESTTETQLKRSLDWLEAQRPKCDTDAETSALTKALSIVQPMLEHTVNPPPRSK